MSSYRPISFFPSLVKLFEKIIFVRIRPILSINFIISNTRFGFRCKHSNAHKVHILTYVIATLYETNFKFDINLNKRHLFVIRITYILIIRSFLENCTFHVRHDNSISSYCPINAVFPQETIFHLTYSTFLLLISLTKTLLC